MVWDITIPEDDDLISSGPGVIRDMKDDIEAALTAQGSFPGADTANPKYKWTPEYGNTAARPSSSLVTGQLYVNTQTGTLQRYNGATWDDILSVADVAITTGKLADGAVTAAKLAAAVAGDGLSGGAGTALAVNVDGSTIEINTDTLRVKDAGITAAKLAAAVAGDGLSGGSGTALAVNVDNSTVEINSDALRVKDAGVTEAKLATAVVNKLGQNIGLVAIVNSGSTGDLVNYSGQGRLCGACVSGIGTSVTFTIVVDGVTVFSGAVPSGSGVSWSDTALASDTASTLNSLDIHFRTSLVINVSAVTGICSIYAAYERAA